MASTPSPWRVATRRSVLARTQAGHVADALAAATGRPAELVPMTTTGDDNPDRAIEAFDAKGLFVDRIREAVLSGDCHLAVHSYKDLPTEAVPGLTIGAVPPRVDPRDLLVTREGHRLVDLPRDATVGTSSVRRKAQLSKVRRDLLVQPLRGNLDTRLGKVADGALDAVVVATAGVLRMKDQIEHQLGAVPLEHGEMLHAPAQGALAVECRADDDETLEALALIDDRDTARCVTAERVFLQMLQGGCTAPIGAHAEVLPGAGAGGVRRIELLGMLSDTTGTRVMRASAQAAETEPEKLGQALALQLLDDGGDAIVQRLMQARRAQADRGA